MTITWKKAKKDKIETLFEKRVFQSTDILNALRQVNVLAFIDKWGPEHIVQVYDPEIGMLGFLVIDNAILGSSEGGIRISETLTPLEVFYLARDTTWKCALYNIPFGGAFAGIKANPYTTEKPRLIKSFAEKISPYVPNKLILRPDMNVNEDDVALFVETTGDIRSATGKPEKYGGIPASYGAVGYGLGIALETSLEFIQDTLKLPDDLSELNIAIQGFGKVGLGLTKFLVNRGVRIVAISDYWGGIYSSTGIDISEVKQYSNASCKKQSLIASKGGNPLIHQEDIYKVECDIFIPCACENMIDQKNCSSLKAKYILEGANRGISNIAESLLRKRNCLILPDILVNAGGDLCSYTEFEEKSIADAFHLIKKEIKKATERVLQLSAENGLSPRTNAKEIAREKLLEIWEKNYNDRSFRN
ncbi:MAG: Glu/Leu/Phe/Val family dehydrogenase [Candidatus Hodarchaeales archaeon]